ncbi:hypothetical protein [Streptomyces sp. YGL11-2]|uniref:hypothetical protein n=1 Tax=Streptomyces sp. YGL11-2 TaxID=3414028 RepID=UPI003CE8366C
MKKPRRSDVPVAIVVAVVDLVIMTMLASAYGLSGLSAGAPDAREVRQHESDEITILVMTALLAGGGCALAALCRFWKTSITHLVVTGLPLLACVTWQEWS